MTYQHDFTLPTELLEQLTQEGLEGLPEMIRILVNEAMRLERQNHLQARPYERTDGRRGYANGYKPKRVKTRVGEINFEVPQVREGGFYPGALSVFQNDTVTLRMFGVNGDEHFSQLFPRMAQRWHLVLLIEGEKSSFPSKQIKRVTIPLSVLTMHLRCKPLFKWSRQVEVIPWQLVCK